MSTDDLDLVQRCVEGNAEAWEEFVKRTGSAIYRGATVALRKFRVSDRETLENVHQQVYVELLRGGARVLTTYQGKSDLEGWVAVIAMRTAYRIMRKRGPEASLPEILPADKGPSPGERAERSEFLDRLDAAFRKLGREDLALVRLAFYEKLSYKEIAEALKIPLNSVSPKLIRAQDKLKKYME